VFAWFRKHLAMMNRISGSMLIIVGLLMVTGRFALIAGALAKLTPDWLFERL
jgi:hypothetical protein